MYNESKSDLNIDMYIPQMMLKSSQNVKMNHKFTRLTKIKKSLTTITVSGQISHAKVRELFGKKSSRSVSANCM